MFLRVLPVVSTVFSLSLFFFILYSVRYILQQQLNRKYPYRNTILGPKIQPHTLTIFPQTSHANISKFNIS